MRLVQARDLEVGMVILGWPCVRWPNPPTITSVRRVRDGYTIETTSGAAAAPYVAAQLPYLIKDEFDE